MKKSLWYLIALSSLLSTTACSDKKESVNSSVASASNQVSSSSAASSLDTLASSQGTSSQGTVSTTITTDTWVGRWNGPEGTFLDISGSNGSYTLTIQNLDGPKQYQGTRNGDYITFERDGTTETLQASNGADTGMKWLAEKSDCLRVRPGEGWCRD